MFRTIASLMLFGALSPVSSPRSVNSDVVALTITPPSIVSSVSVGSSFSASGAIVMDMLTGQEIFGRRADEPRAVGSLAKLMTAIIILEEHNLNDLVTIPRSVENVEGNRVGLQPGDRYTIHDLLAAALVSSANDAAHALAVEHSDSIALFAQEMNTRAQSLGLLQTHFINPIGFDHPERLYDKAAP